MLSHALNRFWHPRARFLEQHPVRVVPHELPAEELDHRRGDGAAEGAVGMVGTLTRQ